MSLEGSVIYHGCHNQLERRQSSIIFRSEPIAITCIGTGKSITVALREILEYLSVSEFESFG